MEVYTMKSSIEYNLEIIDHMVRSGQIDISEAQFMRNYIQGIAF